jgi:hypothetical protein
LIFSITIALVGLSLALFPSLSTRLVESCPYLDGATDGAITQRLKGLYDGILSVWPFAHRYYGPGIRIDPETGLPVFARAALKKYDGSDTSLPILLGMGGEVFDVSGIGTQFYGKDAPYNCFAGRDSTRALTKGTLTDDDLDTWYTGDFDDQLHAQVVEQRDFYRKKYRKIGLLAAEEAPLPADLQPPAPPVAAPSEDGAMQLPGPSGAASDAPSDEAVAADVLTLAASVLDDHAGASKHGTQEL